VVLVGDEVQVTTDFLVVEALSGSSGDDLPLCAMPVFKEFVTAFALLEKDLPPAPTVKPSRRVMVSGEFGEAEREFSTKKPLEGEFKLCAARRPPRRSTRKTAKRKH